MEPNLINLLLQGTPYGILVVCLVTVWSKYQDALKNTNELHAAQSVAHQKLIDLLLSKVEK